MTITITVETDAFDVTDLLDELTKARALAQSRNERAMLKTITYNEDTTQLKLVVELREPDPDWFGEQPKKQAV